MGIYRIEMLATIACCMALILSTTFNVAYAPDPAPLQDFCVGVLNSTLPVSVNGLFCKNPSEVTSSDFVFHGFNTVGNTSNRFGTASVMTNVFRLPSLNTLGVSMGRVDYAPGGVNPLHFHPRASEMLTVLQGTLYAGVVSSNSPDGMNTFYSAVLNEGDIFVFPQGLVHFQINLGGTPAVANTAFGSQNPGRVDVADAVFGSTPRIDNVVLSKSFQVNETVVQALMSQFANDEKAGNLIGLEQVIRSKDIAGL